MKIDAIGIGAYLESSKTKPTSTQVRDDEIKSSPRENAILDKIELSTHTDLTELLSSEEKELLDKLFGYEQSIRNLNKDLKFYTKQDHRDRKVLGTKIDLIA